MVVEHCKDGEESSESGLIVRLLRFTEDSDLSFYTIASRLRTSGTILSMWLAGKAKPDAEEVASIEKFLGD